MRTHDDKPSSNRSFGWVFTMFFLVIGLWPLFFEGVTHWWALITSAVVLHVTLAPPALLTLPNRLWLKFGLILNRITSPVVLSLVFYGVVTPIGALMRLLRKDNLRLARKHLTDSYWVMREPHGTKPDTLKNQFWKGSYVVSHKVVGMHAHTQEILVGPSHVDDSDLRQYHMSLIIN